MKISRRSRSIQRVESKIPTSNLTNGIACNTVTRDERYCQSVLRLGVLGPLIPAMVPELTDWALVVGHVFVQGIAGESPAAMPVFEGALRLSACKEDSLRDALVMNISSWG
jgi:hypothetical protein